MFKEMGFCIIIVCAIILGKARALEKEYLYLTEHILQSSPKCVTVLYRLDASDSNKISNFTKSPILIVNKPDLKLQEKLQEFLSTGRSRCVKLFVHQNRLDNDVIENLLNSTTHRSVIVYNASSNGFNKYFQDSVVLVQSLLSGNLLLTKSMPADKIPMRTMIWLKRDKVLLMPNHIDYTLSTNAARSSLRDKIVIVSAVTFNPFVIFLPNKTYGGVEIEIVKMLSKQMGFSYKIKEEKTWSGIDPVTHKLTDMFGSLVYGVSQLGLSSGISGATPTSPYAHTPHTYILEFNYLVPKPKPLQPFNNFVRPFTLTVWLCFLLSLVICSVLAFLLTHNDKDSFRQSYGDILFALFGSLWQQKMEDTLVSPNSGTYFVIFGFWIVAMAFKGAAYNCDLRSFIVRTVYEKPIETEQDLVSREINVYMADGTGVPEYYQYSKSRDKNDIYARAVKHKAIFPYKDTFGTVLQRMVQEGGARVGIKIRNQYELSVIAKKVGYQPMRPTKFVSFTWQQGIGMPYHQPWSEEVNMNVLRMTGSGIVDMLIRRVLPGAKESVPNEEEDLQPYRIEHVAGPLMALGFGLSVSIAIAAVEIVEGYLSIWGDVARDVQLHIN